MNNERGMEDTNERCTAQSPTVGSSPGSCVRLTQEHHFIWWPPVWSSTEYWLLCLVMSGWNGCEWQTCLVGLAENNNEALVWVAPTHLCFLVTLTQGGCHFWGELSLVQTNHRCTWSFTEHVAMPWSLRSAFPSSSSAMVMGQWYHTTPSLVDVTISLIFHHNILSRAVHAYRRGDCTCRGWSSAQLNHGIWSMELLHLDLLCMKKPHTSSCVDSGLNKPLPTTHLFCLTTILTRMHEPFPLICNSLLSKILCCIFPSIHFKKKKPQPPLPIYLFSLFHLYFPVL